MLDKLPGAQRQALIMYYFKDMAIIDIASAMQSSELAVRSLIKRGKAALRDNAKATIMA
jgi:RNA polymerase sigma-70 factor (ECF subfamily)